MEEGIRLELQGLSENVWKIFNESNNPHIVSESIPILYFGNVEKYLNSPLKIVTVGLNPSKIEFPESNRTLRFDQSRDIAKYISTLNTYFKNNPYKLWFDSYESMLNGLQSSYYSTQANTAIHTDICSPFATDPTWSKLDTDSKESLSSPGISIWHQLVRILEPDIILISVAQNYLSDILFPTIHDWHQVYTLERSNPYAVSMAKMKIGQRQTNFIFGSAAQTPFGTVSKQDKILIGKYLYEELYGK